VQIIDAAKDVRAFVNPISAGATPGLMAVTPNRVQTLVFSAADNRLTLISNGGESVSTSIVLPGFTESFVISPDSLTAYAAVPTAPVVAQPPGVVEVINLNTGAITAGLSVPAVRFVAIGRSGNRLLAFSDNSDSVAVITPSNIGTGNPVVTFVGGFYRPVAAFFTSDDNTAYVVNCGHECGGTPVNGVEASVQTLDLTTSTPGVAIPVPGASVAAVDGATMYLAGTPVPGPLPCTGQTTAAASCGLLTVFDLISMTVVNPAPIVITDGYHQRMALGANGQLFVGARSCTEIIPPVPPPPDAEVRGCLSIYNTQTGAVVIPPASGDVTGIEPISNRNVVYLVQGGELQIYDTTTDKLQELQIDIAGQVIDVKVVDF
jgi:DNA-binding beta-propeller fold protein YncE